MESPDSFLLRRSLSPIRVSLRQAGPLEHVAATHRTHYTNSLRLHRSLEWAHASPPRAAMPQSAVGRDAWRDHTDEMGQRNVVKRREVADPAHDPDGTYPTRDLSGIAGSAFAPGWEDRADERRRKMELARLRGAYASMRPHATSAYTPTSHALIEPLVLLCLQTSRDGRLFQRRSRSANGAGVEAARVGPAFGFRRAHA